MCGIHSWFTWKLNLYCLHYVKQIRPAVQCQQLENAASEIMATSTAFVACCYWSHGKMFSMVKKNSTYVHHLFLIILQEMFLKKCPWNNTVTGSCPWFFPVIIFVMEDSGPSSILPRWYCAWRTMHQCRITAICKVFSDSLREMRYYKINVNSVWFCYYLYES